MCLFFAHANPQPLKNFGNIDWEQLQRDILHRGQKDVGVGHNLKTVLQFIEKNAEDGGLFLILSNSTCLGLWESEFVGKLEKQVMSNEQ